MIFIYLILCQLDLISSFIRVDQFFDFIDYILDYILKLWGFGINIEEDKVSLIPQGEEIFQAFIKVLMIGGSFGVVFVNVCVKVVSFLKV